MAAGSTTIAPMPSGPRSHFWAGSAYKSAPSSSNLNGIAPAACAPSTTTSAPRSWAIAAIRAIGRTAPVVHRTCEMATRRVPGVIAASNAAMVRSSSPSSPASTKTISAPVRWRRAYNGPTPPACSWAVVTTRPPVRQSGSCVAAFIASVVEWVSPTAATSVPRTAATPARASAMRASVSVRSSGWPRPRSRSWSAISAMAAAVSAGSGPTDPVAR